MTLSAILHNAACVLRAKPLPFAVMSDEAGVNHVAEALFIAADADGQTHASAVAFMSGLGFQPLNAYAYRDLPSEEDGQAAAFDSLILASLVAEDIEAMA